MQEGFQEALTSKEQNRWPMMQENLEHAFGRRLNLAFKTSYNTEKKLTHQLHQIDSDKRAISWILEAEPALLNHRFDSNMGTALSEELLFGKSRINFNIN